MYIDILGKNISIEVEGLKENPKILILGPAQLYKKPGYLPDSLKELSQIYYVDIFEMPHKPKDYSKLTLNEFVNIIGEIISRLDLNDVILFGHSINGILALEVNARFPEKILTCILIGTPPYWDDSKNNIINDYFMYNASVKKIAQYTNDIILFNQSIDQLKGQEKFLSYYNSKRILFFSNLQSTDIWDNLQLDISLIDQFYKAVYGFDIRNENYLHSLRKSLIIVGLRDYSCPFYLWTDEACKFFKDEVLNFFIFENSSHFPQMDEAEKFTHCVLKHIGFLCDVPSVTSNAISSCLIR